MPVIDDDESVELPGGGPFGGNEDVPGLRKPISPLYVFFTFIIVGGCWAVMMFYGILADAGGRFDTPIRLAWTAGWGLVGIGALAANRSCGLGSASALLGFAVIGVGWVLF